MKKVNMQNEYDLFMEKYVELPLEEQRKHLINSLKFILGINMQLCETVNTPFDILYNKEVSDLDNEDVSEKDVLEAAMAYIYLIKKSSTLYMDEYAKELMKNSEI